MSKRGYGFWIVLVGVLIAAMAIGPDLWAAPGQRPERQTVPTRTPALPSTEPPPPTATSHPPKDQPTPVPTAAVEATPTAAPVEVTPTAAPVEPLLPTAGGWNTGLHVGVAMIVTGLLLIVAARRHA